MDVVGHHNESVELVSFESILAILQSMDHQLRDLRPAKVERAGSGMIEQSVHRHKGLARGEPLRWEHAVGREASTKPESHEEPLTNRIRMGKAAIIHLCLLW